jgi:drug/metabolite transporter, DME family
MRSDALGSRLAILAGAVLWSTAGAAIKLCHLDAIQIAAGRSLVACLALFAFFPRARVWPGPRVLGVALAHGATVLLFVLANKRTTAANAIFIQDTAPLWVLLFSLWLLGERPGRAELWSVPVFVVGLVFFFLDRLSAGQLSGNLIAALAGVTFALSIVGFRGLGDGVAAIAWGNLLVASIGLPFALRGPVPAAPDLGIVLFLGLVQLALANLLFTWGLRRTTALEGSLLALLEPVLNPVWAFLLAGERPGRWALVGGAVILVATASRTLAASRSERV